MALRRSTRRVGRRPGGDGIMAAMVGLVAAVPLTNAAVGLVRASSPWLLLATLAAAASLIGVALLALRLARRHRGPYAQANARTRRYSRS
jgi:restriction system protein